MKATDLRIGNYHYYHIEDKFADPKEWDEVCTIDAEDLVWLSKPEGEADTDYKPIPLTEERLMEFGFERNGVNTFWKDPMMVVLFPEGALYFANQRFVNLIYVHQLQNLYFAITGIELTKIK